MSALSSIATCALNWVHFRGRAQNVRRHPHAACLACLVLKILVERRPGTHKGRSCRCTHSASHCCSTWAPGSSEECASRKAYGARQKSVLSSLAHCAAHVLTAGPTWQIGFCSTLSELRGRADSGSIYLRLLRWLPLARCRRHSAPGHFPVRHRTGQAPPARSQPSAHACQTC